jgi:Tfp pilus assembly protein PilO
MARTRTEQLWIAGGAVGTVALAVAAWLFVISPKFSQATSLRSDTDQVRAGNAAMQQDLTALRSQYAHMGQLRAERDKARQALPTDNSLDAFTRQIALQARAAHVSVSMMNTDDPAPATSSAPVAVAPSTAGTDVTSAPVAVPTGPSAAQGLYGIPVTLTVNGSAANDVRFLHAVQQQGPRAVLVSSVQLASGDTTSTGSTTGGKVAMTIALQVFVEAIPSAAPTSVTAAPAPAVASPTPSPVAAGN